MGFLDKVKDSFNTVVDKIEQSTTLLGKVIKENKEMLNAHLKLSKESKEGINILSEYGEQETPAFKEAFLTISDSLNAIESNRAAMVTQLQQDYINPLEELIAKWSDLQEILKAEQKAEKESERMRNSLKKKQAKEESKLKPGELDTAAEKLQKSVKKAKDQHANSVAETTNFNQLKYQTLKSTLETLVSRQKEFHNQALHIISNAEKLVDNIDFEKEANLSAD